ncbi:MAG TPA: transcription termination factor NusA [Coleofasciculaceae cyanobacterium]|jgi:N utilization substance protein A
MIKVGPALMEHAEQLERERGIPRDVVISSLKEAMLAAYKRYAKLENLTGYECRLNEKSGEIGIYELRRVVEELSDPEDIEYDEEGEEIPREPEITLKDARKIKPDVELNDILEIEVTPDEFGRIAAQSAKQVITQRIREAEKRLVQKEFEDKRGSVTTAIVQRIEGRNVIVNIGKSEAILPPREQLPSEYYRVGNKLRVYILDLKDSGRVPQIIVSQAHPAMVKEVFELEVPEIEDGLVEIKSIAREAGYRTKVAVVSHDPDVDAQGACIGTRGSRIQAIVNELKNEKIDIIRWSADPMEFITHALAPAKIIKVLIMPDPRQARGLVIVPDDQLSLAIGREGQNVRLAAKLTGFKLDIKSISQIEHEGGMAYFEQMAAAAPYTEEGYPAEEGFPEGAPPEGFPAGEAAENAPVEAEIEEAVMTADVDASIVTEDAYEASEEAPLEAEEDGDREEVGEEV